MGGGGLENLKSNFFSSPGRHFISFESQKKKKPHSLPIVIILMLPLACDNQRGERDEVNRTKCVRLDPLNFELTTFSYTELLKPLLFLHLKSYC